MLAALVPALGPPLCGLVLHLAYTPGHRVCAALLLLALTGMAFGIAGLIDADRAELIVEMGIYAQLSASAIFFAHPHRGCSLVLGGLALCGTALGVAEPFVPAIPAAIAPLCFLLLALVALGIVRSCMEMMLTLLTMLISNVLFLVAALVPQAKAVEAIQTVWVTLPICAFMLAFTRHSQVTPQSPRISISVSIARRQDQLDLPFRKVTSLSGHPALGTTGLARFRKWLAPAQQDMSISLSNLHHPDHARFPSTSSSFSSPPQPPHMDVDLEHGKAFHHVPNLEPLPQLPSPPDTPRARVRTATPIPHAQCLSSPANDSTVVTDNDQDVRIGMVTPAEKPNLTIRDIFTEAEQYEVACETAQVVDTPVSEPGHGSREFSDSGDDDPIQKSLRASCSVHTPTPSPIPMPTPVPRSPVLSSPSSWVFSNFKRPIKSRSMMSLPLSFGSASGSASPPTLSWKGADKLRERFKRPIAGVYGRALSLSQSPTLHPSNKEDALDSVEEEEDGQDNQKATGHQHQHHKRKGSAWSSLSQKSPTFMFMSSVPIMATTTSPSSGSEWEWYPSLSKSKSSMSNLNQGQVLASSISNKKKREQITIPPPASSSDHHQQSETADFVDLTDPFASPTPGFALPKWVGNNGSSVTAASGASGGFGTYGVGVGTNWNGSVSDIGHGGPTNPSWGHESGENDQDIDVNDKEGTTTTRNVPKTIKSRSSAQWGKLPPIPPLPSSSNPDGLKKKQERLEKTPTRTAMTTEGVKRTRPSRQRSDSPIKTQSSGTNLMRIVDDAEDEDEDRESEAEKEILERPGSPIPPSPLMLTTVMELGISRVTRPTVVIDDNVDVLGSGQLQRKKMNTTIDSDAKNIFNSSSSRKKKGTGIKSRRGRNGSPLPIPFRRNKSHRHVANGNVGGTREMEEKEEGDIDGLNLEEMLLAQRLLKMLNSDEGAV